MNENILFKSEGTQKFDSSEFENLSGKPVNIFRCSTELNSAGVDKYLGIVVDTLSPADNPQSSVFEQPFENIQKEAPALRVLNKQQEGHALTFQKWKGVVKDILEETFVAELTDLLRDIPEEEAEFFSSDVQEDDKELLSVGAIFYWCVGYVFSPSGQLSRVSFLRFQRLPSYSSNSFKLANQKAKEIQDNITWL